MQCLVSAAIHLTVKSSVANGATLQCMSFFVLVIFYGICCAPCITILALMKYSMLPNNIYRSFLAKGISIGIRLTIMVAVVRTLVQAMRVMIIFIRTYCIQYSYNMQCLKLIYTCQSLSKIENAMLFNILSESTID